MASVLNKAAEAGGTKGKEVPATMAEAMLSDKADWEYVTIPEEDAIGGKHPGIGLNLMHFGPGVHQVPPVVAQFINERLKIYDRQTRRILLPRQDEKTTTQLARQGIPSYDASQMH